MKTATKAQAVALTATTRPLDRLTTAVERMVCAIAWATQVTAAATYLVIGGQPSVWRPLFDKDPVSVVLTWMVVACLLALWAVSLRQEQRHFYDRTAQRIHRKAALLGHLGVLFIAAVAAAASPHRIGLWVILGMLCFASVVTWASWMQARFLPDEDQAVIDALFAREAAQRAAVHDASEREQRRERLTAVVRGLGFELTDASVPTSALATTSTVKWPIPKGKHAPLVYFIRNGNRLKIGTTVELKRRIRTLALRAENVALLVDGDQRREREYHQQFAEHRIGNTEWFAYEGSLADYVRAEAGRISQERQGK
jgi:hypothetical protein